MRVCKNDRTEAKPAVDAAEAYVRAAWRGDRDAAQSLLTILLPRVRNLVRYLVRRDEDTDDIAQEALIAILRGLAGFRADGPFKAWVDRVVVRATFAFLRKRGREPASGPSRLQLADVGDTQGLNHLPDQYLVRRRAVAVLDELPLEQRHAIVLHHVLEMSVPEIADQLDLSIETVRSRLRLARTRLRASNANASASANDQTGRARVSSMNSVRADDAAPLDDDGTVAGEDSLMDDNYDNLVVLDDRGGSGK